MLLHQKSRGLQCCWGIAGILQGLQKRRRGHLLLLLLLLG
jgi:hypothetical protein